MPFQQGTDGKLKIFGPGANAGKLVVAGAGNACCCSSVIVPKVRCVYAWSGFWTRSTGAFTITADSPVVSCIDPSTLVSGSSVAPPEKAWLMSSINLFCTSCGYVWFAYGDACTPCVNGTSCDQVGAVCKNGICPGDGRCPAPPPGPSDQPPKPTNWCLCTPNNGTT